MKNRFTIAYTLAFFFTPVVLNAQTPQAPEIEQLTRKLENALRGNDLSQATEIAAALDEAVQQRYRAWLIRDAGERVRDVLTWLPSDTESFFAHQEPFVIRAEDSPSLFYGRPGRRYATDRLMALGEGSAYRAFHGTTVRLVAAGIRNIRGAPSGVPAPMPQADVAYFYFLAEPVNPGVLGEPDEVSEQNPLWHRKASVYSDGPLEPGMEPSTREESTWLALPRPNLLVTASSQLFLDLILKRMAAQTSRQALPDELPEWREVNRAAPFWGLRHYTDPDTRKDNSNPKSRFSDPEDSDPGAIGAAFQYGVEADIVEAFYLSTSDQLPQQLAHFYDESNEFKVDRPHKGMWRLRSNIRERGDFPFHVCMYLLGFGVYN